MNSFRGSARYNTDNQNAENMPKVSILAILRRNPTPNTNLINSSQRIRTTSFTACISRALESVEQTLCRGRRRAAGARQWRG